MHYNTNVFPAATLKSGEGLGDEISFTNARNLCGEESWEWRHECFYKSSITEENERLYL